MVTRITPNLGHGRLIRPRTFYVPWYAELVDVTEQIWNVYPEEDIREEYDEEFIYKPDPDTFPQIFGSVITVVQSSGRNAEDDSWYDPRISDLVYDTDHITVVIDHEEQIDEDDHWIYRLDDEVYDQVIFVEAFDEDPPQEDDHFIYRQDDLVFDTDQIFYVIDHDLDPDPEDDHLIYRLEDQPTAASDNEQIVIVFLDDDAREEFEDEWADAYGNIDVPLVDVSEQIWFVYPEEDIREEYDEDFIIYRLDDQVYDIDQITTVIDHEEVIHEDDDFYHRLDDLVYDVDHITIIVDHEEEVHVDDDYIYRLDDQVYDQDQVVFVEAFDERLDEEDDFVLSRLDDLVFDTDQVVFIPDDQVKEPEDFEDDTFDPFTDFVTTAVTGNEQIVFISEYDEYFDWDPEDDLYDAYGNFDTPAVIIITDIHAKPFLSTMGRMGALGGFS